VAAPLKKNPKKTPKGRPDEEKVYRSRRIEYHIILQGLKKKKESYQAIFECEKKKQSEGEAKQERSLKNTPEKTTPKNHF